MNKTLASYDVMLYYEDETLGLTKRDITIACGGFENVYEVVCQYISDNDLRHGEIEVVRKRPSVVMDFGE